MGGISETGTELFSHLLIVHKMKSKEMRKKMEAGMCGHDSFKVLTILDTYFACRNECA